MPVLMLFLLGTLILPPQTQNGVVRVTVKVPGTLEPVSGAQVSLTATAAPTTVPTPSTPTPPPPPVAGVYSVGGGVTEPRIRMQPQPEYSDEARKARVQGTVEMLIVVKIDGTVDVLSVTTRLGYGLDEKATEAVKRWVFDPGQRDGKPVPVYVSVRTTFRLGGEPATPAPTPMPPSAGVAITMTSGATAGVPSVTDSNGVATFSNLAPGRYNITARRDGFMGAAPAGLVLPFPPPSASASVTVSIDQWNHDVTLSLVPGATISGVIKGATGMPIANARVFAGVLGYREGRRSLLPGPSVTTDPGGEYRLSSLGPGDYYIRVERPPTQQGVGTYYPGVVDLEKAVMIAVRGSEEVLAIDFAFPAIPSFKVSGAIRNLPATGPNGPANGILGLTYVPRDGNTPDPVTTPLIPMAGVAGSNEFSITLPVGSWYLFPVIPLNVAGASLTGSTPRYATGRASIDVVDRDIGGVVISITSVDVKGKVVMTDSPAAQTTTLSTLRVSLIPKESAAIPLVAHLRTLQQLDAGGEFVFSAVPPGKYSLQITPIPPGLHVADIRLGSTSVFSDGVINVGSEALEPLEVTLSGRGGVIQGVAPAIRPEESATARVVLVPSGNRRGNPMFYKTTTLVRGTGSFNFSDVPPGDYKVFALKTLPSGGAEQSAEFIAKYEDYGQAATVIPGQVTNVQLPIIAEVK